MELDGGLYRRAARGGGNHDENVNAYVNSQESPYDVPGLGLVPPNLVVCGHGNSSSCGHSSSSSSSRSFGSSSRSSRSASASSCEGGDVDICELEEQRLKLKHNRDWINNSDDSDTNSSRFKTMTLFLSITVILCLCLCLILSVWSYHARTELMELRRVATNMAADAGNRHFDGDIQLLLSEIRELDVNTATITADVATVATINAIDVDVDVDVDVAKEAEMTMTDAADIPTETDYSLLLEKEDEEATKATKMNENNDINENYEEESDL